MKADALPDNCPYCTNSIEHTYIDVQTHQEVAILHSYLRPDGTTGASGKRDPKFLVWDGAHYRLPRKRSPHTTPKRHPLVRSMWNQYRRVRYRIRLLLGMESRRRK